MSVVDDVVAQVPLFSGLSGRDRKRLASRFKESTFPSGKVITEKGKEGIGFFVIASGTATVSVNGKARARLKEGDYFGEIALIDEGTRTAEVTADSELNCFGITSWEFRPFVQEHPEVAWPLLQSLVKRIRELESKLDEVSA
jgi:CRP-like cAMP-binding protein